MVKNLPANAGDMGLIPGLGIFHMPGSTTETACPRGHRPQLERNLHSLMNVVIPSVCNFIKCEFNGYIIFIN